jgi:hypothetical protein
MTDTTSTTSTAPSDLSSAVIHLMKGPVYRDTHEQVWDDLVRLRRDVGDYVSVLGLTVVLDEAEGYAYLKSRAARDDDPDLPRLVARRTLSFHVSMLLALLRKRLAEFDATSADTRLVLTRDQIVDMLRLYLPDSANEARIVETIDGHIRRVVEMGFLRPLRNQEQVFEVRRILKAFVDGQWLSDFDQRLEEYSLLVGHGEEQGDGS